MLQDETNETEVLSDQLLIAQDIISMLRFPKFDWDIGDSVSLEFYTETQEDYLAGVKADITVIFPMLSDRCQVPTNFNYPN